MSDLSALHLKTAYRKGEDDIAERFYLPCMRSASQYDRAVGFFRSTVFLIAWPALREFVRAGGRMRVLCSQVMADADIAALRNGYSDREDLVGNRLVAEIRAMTADNELREPSRILAALVANGVLDLKVALVSRGDLIASRGRIFHDKLGIFSDALGNRVAFKGSMNETWMGLAADGNIESVDVAASWMGARDLERIDDDQSYFDSLWSNSYPDLVVKSFPEVAQEHLQEIAHPDWDEALERALVKQARYRAEGKQTGRSLYAHQAMGLASWAANGRRGILAFATGSGKTFTALTAMREAINERREVVVLIVPDVTLFAQWFAEITAELADLDVTVLRAGAGHSRWRDSLGLWTEPGNRPRIVLATLQTAANDDFLSRLKGGPHLMLVADEVHRLGAPQRRLAMSDHYGGPRLGLSATPHRAGDPDGTARILDYFSGVLEPQYSLADAVRDGVLTRYFYRPHVVTLSSLEKIQWEDETTQIKRLRARMGAGDADERLPGRLKQLLIRRSRIVKGAAAKVPLAADVLRESYQPGQRWLVYCENVQQLEAVTAALTEVGITAFPYHSRMTGDRAATLEWLDRRGGVVTSIRCLDEGVDIPSVTHALILASSKNPREFIQRRGRVLRRADGKALAYVHDAIVTPPRDPDDPGGRSWDPITSGELARAVEFAEHAENAAAISDIKVAAIDAGLDWRSAIGEGVEDD